MALPWNLPQLYCQQPVTQDCPQCINANRQANCICEGSWFLWCNKFGYIMFIYCDQLLSCHVHCAFCPACRLCPGICLNYTASSRHITPPSVQQPDQAKQWRFWWYSMLTTSSQHSTFSAELPAACAAILPAPHLPREAGEEMTIWMTQYADNGFMM